ncbi:MAG: hypothetical protein WC895_05050 [Candidatus Shapirobacteria bacterium]|jgi:hypothetical protein
MKPQKKISEKQKELKDQREAEKQLPRNYEELQVCPACQGEGVTSYSCSSCQGTGKELYAGKEIGPKCPRCHGSGRFYPRFDPKKVPERYARLWTVTNVKGEDVEIKVYSCKRCHGEGKVKAEVGHGAMAYVFAKAFGSKG